MKKIILNFIDGWEQGKLKLHLKTQEEPKENNGDIFVVVGKTFQKEVIDNNKDVMLVFYAPWCVHCRPEKEHHHILNIKNMSKKEKWEVVQV